jgi:hypothetical protein
MRSKDHEKKIDESLRLVAAFMKVKDEKARSEIIKLAERSAQFEPSESLFQFSGVPKSG